MRSCPHEDIRFCPLYVASHVGNGRGCMDGREGEGSCAVARGLNYKRELKLIEADDPVLVAQLAWKERKELFQARRN